MSYTHVCSLGTICHTGRFMQRLKIKNTSYPFDWVFSDSKGVIDCLQDGFDKLLDPKYYVDIKNKYSDRSCGHSLYHEDFFFHKDPRNEDDHQYYKRCVDRFKKLCDSQEKKLFIFFLSPENTKHPTDLSLMMESGSTKESVIEVMKQQGRELNTELTKHTSNYRLVLIMNFGDNETQTHNFEQEGYIDFLTLNTRFASKGVTFNEGWVNNRDPDNYYLSGLFSELYQFT